MQKRKKAKYMQSNDKRISAAQIRVKSRASQEKKCGNKQLNILAKN